MTPVSTAPLSWHDAEDFDLDIDGPAPRWMPDAGDIGVFVADVLDRVGPKPVPAELSLQFVSDAVMTTLNSDYRGKAKPTNVLSFPTFAGSEIAAAADGARGGGLPLHFGDIALAPAVAAAEADIQGKTRADHVRHLIVHGVLHLLGFDHIEACEAERMEAHEIALLAAHGIANPYAAVDGVLDDDGDDGDG